MKFRALEIENFRAITYLKLSDLSDVIVIAGPNGCGKSQIFHAIRLLKSVYGGYQPDEWRQWFNEFQVNLERNPQNALGLFRSHDKPVQIRAELILSDFEKAYLQENAADLLRPLVWEEVSPSMNQPAYMRVAPLARMQRTHENEVDERIKKETEVLLKELEKDFFILDLTILPNLETKTSPNLAIELVFGIYAACYVGIAPRQIGIIDYHSPERNYQREQIGGINLNIQSTEERIRQHSLYNWQNKYTNIKTELAASYVRDLVARQACLENADNESLTETLQELFATFFPGKRFLGPQPQADGILSFPVKLQSGGQHDIDELSSGEKEVLYGYLRLRNAAPENSILLLDEPELHLNPRLIQGLPQFYHRHLGKVLNNQLWLVTHSDALLRQAVGQKGFSVFHMQSSDTSEPSGNQVYEIKVEKDIERAIIDLVGDLASYRPSAKVVIFEGSGKLEFDIWMTGILFPDFQSTVNMIAAGSKKRVASLHELLRKAAKQGELSARFFSIVDKDADTDEYGESAFCWDSYHIENYLLEPYFIIAALRDINALTSETETEEGMLNALRRCAENTLYNLVRHEVEQFANKKVSNTIHTRCDRSEAEVTSSLRKALEKTIELMKSVVDEELSENNLRQLEQTTRDKLQKDLKDSTWLRTFRGRDILNHFVNQFVPGNIKYEIVRDLIVSRMRDHNFQPPGMKEVIAQIMAS